MKDHNNNANNNNTNNSNYHGANRRTTSQQDATRISSDINSLFSILHRFVMRRGKYYSCTLAGVQQNNDL